MPAPIVMATWSVGPTPRWSKRSGAAMPCWRIATGSTMWTAGAEQFFFSDADECERMIQRILTDDLAVARARAAGAAARGG